MVLPSQSARIDYRRSNMFRRKRVARWPVGAAAVAVGALGIWAAFKVLGPNSGGDSGGPPFQQPVGASVGSVGLDFDQSTTSSSGTPENASQANGDTGRAEDTQRREEETVDSSSRLHVPLAPSEAKASGQPSGIGRETNESDAGTRPPFTAADSKAGSPTPEQMQRASQMMEYAFQLKEQGKLVDARLYFSRAFESGALSDNHAERVLDALQQVNDVLVFSPRVDPDDPYAMPYTIKSGETLSEIVEDKSLLIDWRLVMRLNNIRDERQARAGATIKLLTGPFHAVISKSTYTLDLYLGDWNEKVFIKRFPVGLGEYNSTPTGMFKIGSRLPNPEWINPRTRERFKPDDPSNPIGEYWMQLIGIDDNTKDFTGYGIHGTIEPESIGRQQSMGCVRMLPDDVRQVFECLLTGVSRVAITR